ncbi:hypothetical protein E2C01_040018 [Portunus trituberculatus]|uniref:Uncharacterized protein n=1 Tax=Portunus trituberculatus TaxID=210409 RepID=A0A5B7FIJ2_PORTR|nr:hypothetical protein [Portunus trituberculatus]
MAIQSSPAVCLQYIIKKEINVIDRYVELDLSSLKLGNTSVRMKTSVPCLLYCLPLLSRQYCLLGDSYSLPALSYSGTLFSLHHSAVPCLFPFTVAHSCAPCRPPPYLQWHPLCQGSRRMAGTRKGRRGEREEGGQR